MIGGADDAGAERLGEEQTSPARAPAFVSMRGGIDRAGHRVAELDLRIPHRVAAEQRDARLAQLVEAAEKDLRGSSRASSASFGKPAIASAVSGRPPIA